MKRNLIITVLVAMLMVNIVGAQRKFLRDVFVGVVAALLADEVSAGSNNSTYFKGHNLSFTDLTAYANTGADAPYLSINYDRLWNVTNMDFPTVHIEVWAMNSKYSFDYLPNSRLLLGERKIGSLESNHYYYLNEGEKFKIPLDKSALESLQNQNNEYRIVIIAGYVYGDKEYVGGYSNHSFYDFNNHNWIK